MHCWKLFLTIFSPKNVKRGIERSGFQMKVENLDFVGTHMVAKF